MLALLFLSLWFSRADDPSGYWDTRFTLNTEDWPTSAQFDGRGRLVATGNAPFVFPALAPGLVRWDGRGWTTLITNRLTGSAGIRLAAGPGFMVAGGVPRTNTVMRMDEDSDSAVELPEAVVGRVYAVGVWGAEIIAGGEFTTPSGSVNVARWNGSQWSPLGAGVPNRVTQLLSAEGRLFAASQGLLDGAAATVWEWNGAAWVALGEIAAGGTAVTALCWHEGILTIGINGGASVDCIRQWRDQRWQVPPGETLQAPGVSLAVCRGELWAAGQLKIVGPGGTVGAALVRWTAGRWEPQLRDVTVRGRFVESDGERLLLKADPDGKTTYGMSPGLGLWFREGDTWRLLINGLFAVPNTLAAALGPDGVVVTTDVGDRHLRGSFVWDGIRCRPLPAPPGSAGELLRMKAGLVPVGGAVYGGASYPGTENPHVLLRRTVGPWEQASSRMAVEPQVLTSDGRRIFVAGKSADPALSPQSVLMWTGSEWQAVGGSFDRPISALESWNDHLIAGGSFTKAGGADVSWLARWDGTAWTPLGPPLNGEVRSLHRFGGELYVAGVLSCRRGPRGSGSGHLEWGCLAHTARGAEPDESRCRGGQSGRPGRRGGRGAVQRVGFGAGDQWTRVSESPGGTSLPTLLWRGHDLHVTGGFVELGGLVSDVFGIWHEPGPHLMWTPDSGPTPALTVTGALPVHYRLERSRNLTDWSPWITNSPLAPDQTFPVPSLGEAEEGAYFRMQPLTP